MTDTTQETEGPPPTHENKPKMTWAEAQRINVCQNAKCMHVDLSDIFHPPICPVCGHETKRDRKQEQGLVEGYKNWPKKSEEDDDLWWL